MADNNKIVCLWALMNACLFAVLDIIMLIILTHIPCTKSTDPFWCVAMPTNDAAAAELSSLLYGQLGCVAAAALAAPLHMLLTTTTRSRWAAAVDTLAWLALVATAAIHCLQVASDRIFVIADIVFISVGLVVDLLASFLLCVSRRPGVAEQGGGEQV